MSMSPGLLERLSVEMLSIAKVVQSSCQKYLYSDFPIEKGS